MSCACFVRLDSKYINTLYNSIQSAIYMIQAASEMMFSIVCFAGCYLRFNGSSVQVICLNVSSNLHLPSISIIQQFLLIIQQLFMSLSGIFKIRALAQRERKMITLSVYNFSCFGLNVFSVSYIY